MGTFPRWFPCAAKIEKLGTREALFSLEGFGGGGRGLVKIQILIRQVWGGA